VTVPVEFRDKREYENKCARISFGRICYKVSFLHRESFKEMSLCWTNNRHYAIISESNAERFCDRLELIEHIDLFFACCLILISVGAGFVQRVSGFGLGIFVMLFLPHLMPTHTAASAVSGLLSTCTSAYNAVRYRKHISYKTVFPLIVSAMLVIPIAVYFSAEVPAKFFKVLLGIVLICLSIYFLFFNSKIHIKPNWRNAVLTGALGGALNGLFSTGGPPIVLYLTHAMSDKMIYFASIQFYFALSNLFSAVTRVVNGIITWEIALYALIGLIGCSIGNLIGTKVFDRLDSDKFKKVIYIAMIISGILMFF